MKTYKKVLPEDKFESLKVRGVTTLSFTDITAVVGREYKAINSVNKDEFFMVKCTQSEPLTLKKI